LIESSWNSAAIAAESYPPQSIWRVSDKPQMDAVWVEWIGSDKTHWPQRACVGATLEGKTLVEIVLLAAKA
jgi:hypothetical protein